MFYLLASADGKARFGSVLFLIAGIYIILRTAWNWLIGEITVTEGGGRYSSGPSRVVDRDVNPDEFNSELRTRITVGMIVILFALLLLGSGGN